MEGKGKYKTNKYVGGENIISLRCWASGLDTPNQPNQIGREKANHFGGWASGFYYPMTTLD
jgi:hypothetical protein